MENLLGLRWTISVLLLDTDAMGASWMVVCLMMAVDTLFCTFPGPFLSWQSCLGIKVSVCVTPIKSPEAGNSSLRAILECL